MDVFSLIDLGPIVPVPFRPGQWYPIWCPLSEFRL